jgi:hypothetical protein
MTHPANDSQDYWYIRVPKSRCREPQFHFFQQVGLHWEDDEGNHFYDLGEIVGIRYNARGKQAGQWTYLLRYLKCDADPSLKGSEDDYFEAESHLLPDNTVIE